MGSKIKPTKVRVYDGIAAVIKTFFFGNQALSDYVGRGMPDHVEQVKCTLHYLIAEYRAMHHLGMEYDLTDIAYKRDLTAAILGKYGQGGGLPGMLHEIFGYREVLNGTITDITALGKTIAKIQTHEQEYAARDRAVLYNFYVQDKEYEAMLFLPYYTLSMSSQTKATIFCREVYDTDSFEVIIYDETGINCPQYFLDFLVCHSLSNHCYNTVAIDNHTQQSHQNIFPFPDGNFFGAYQFTQWDQHG